MHLPEDTGCKSRLLAHRQADEGREITINYENIYGGSQQQQYTGQNNQLFDSMPQQVHKTASSNLPLSNKDLDLKGTLIRTRPEYQIQ